MGLERAGVRSASSRRRADCNRCLPQSRRQNPHRASRDTRMLDGMDCRSGWQPDLSAFAQRRNGRVSLRVARCGHRRGSAAQFFKMELIHTTTVALRNRNKIAIDLDLFTLLRKVTEQMRDVTADGAHVRALQF